MTLDQEKVRLLGKIEAALVSQDINSIYGLLLNISTKVVRIENSDDYNIAITYYPGTTNIATITKTGTTNIGLETVVETLTYVSNLTEDSPLISVVRS